MMDYWMVPVPGSATSKMHDNCLDAEAERITRVEGKQVNVLKVNHSFKPPEPAMVTKDIDEILAKLQARTMFVPCVLRSVVLELKKQGTTSLKLPAGVDM